MFADFVEFTHEGVVESINRAAIVNLSLFDKRKWEPQPRGVTLYTTCRKSVSITMGNEGSALHYNFDTEEQAKAVYDLIKEGGTLRYVAPVETPPTTQEQPIPTIAQERVFMDEETAMNRPAVGYGTAQTTNNQMYGEAGILGNAANRTRQNTHWATIAPATRPEE